MTDNKRTTIKRYVNGRGKIFASLKSDGTLTKYETSDQRIRLCGEGHGLPVTVAKDAMDHGGKTLVIVENHGDHIWSIPLAEVIQCRKVSMRGEPKYVFPPEACRIKSKPGAPYPPIASAPKIPKQKPQDHQRTLFDLPEDSGAGTLQNRMRFEQ